MDIQLIELWVICFWPQRLLASRDAMGADQTHLPDHRLEA
jgi:hypothetical protein